MHIEYVEITNFRKLLSVRVDFSKETTLFVGANNSGKTSAVLALRRFLVEKGKRFKTQDFTLSHWTAIDAIGMSWEKLTENEAPTLSKAEWIKILPALDIWLHVENSELHYVSTLLPNLDWSGGILGVRMQLEPSDLEALYREYKVAINDVKNLHKAAEIAKEAIDTLEQHQVTKEEKRIKLWPVSLTDFLSRKLNDHFVMKSYILDPKKIELPVKGQAKPQILPEDSLELESDPLKSLIRVNEINAQRGLGESDGADIDGGLTTQRDGNRLSDQLRAYYSKHLDPFSAPGAADLAAIQAIEAAQDVFDKRLHDSFSPALGEVEGMGYPGVFDPTIKIASQLKTTDGLNHEAAITFEIKMVENPGSPPPSFRLPEGYNGLGYQNLISMIFRLMSFRDAWMRVGKASKSMAEIKIEPLHLVIVEEPEAHLHAQVQQVFIKKAYSVLRAHTNLGTHSRFKSQLIVSSHSSHVAHETSFSCLRYFRRLPAGMAAAVPVSTVVNLTDVFGEGTDTERFVTRYLRAQHCDLFFADAAILVEGPAEKTLVPNFIRRDFSFLNQCYVSLLEINGSHSHRLRDLIDALGLLTLIITDIDAAENGSGKSVIPERNKDQKTGNSALKSWTPRIEKIDDLLRENPDKKVLKGDELFSVRTAYQIPVLVKDKDGTNAGEALPSTFEDSLAFENLSFFEELEGNGMTKKFREAITSKKNNIPELAIELFNALDGKGKAAFALDILFSKNFDILKCPAYIHEGLSWLEERLRRKQVDILSEPIKTGGE